MTKPLADWQLPPGVNRGLWDYIHDAQLARTYDEGVKDCGLVNLDVEFVRRHCTPPDRLLDLGCGTGRALVPLAQDGYWTLGVDLSEEMLRLAGEKAASAGVPVHRLKANLVELDALRDSSFAYALCLFSTLGMILGRDNRRKVLDHIHRMLRPDGRLILHAHNRWFNAGTPTGRRWLVKDVLRSVRGAPDAGDCVMPTHDGQSSLTLHLFTRREIRRLLQTAGFRILELRPVTLRPDGALRRPWLFGALRTYGYLIAAEKR